MGVEHEEEALNVAAIKHMAELLEDHLATLNSVAQKMAERDISSFQVKHMTKARTSIKKLGEFTNLVKQTLDEWTFKMAFPQREAKKEMTKAPVISDEKKAETRASRSAKAKSKRDNNG